MRLTVDWVPNQRVRRLVDLLLVLAGDGVPVEDMADGWFDGAGFVGCLGRIRLSFTRAVGGLLAADDTWIPAKC